MKDKYLTKEEIQYINDKLLRLKELIQKHDLHNEGTILNLINDVGSKLVN